MVTQRTNLHRVGHDKYTRLSLIASLAFGDGYVGQKKRWCPLNWQHSLKQKDYALWKCDMVKKYIGISPKVYYGTQNEYSYINCVFHNQKYNPRIRHMLYEESGRKYVSEGFLNLLKTDLALLIWYLDDGSLYYHKRDGKVCSREICLSTEGFNKDENLLMRDWFKRNYDIAWRVNKSGTSKTTGNKYYRLVGGAGVAKKFFSLLNLRDVPSSMMYKFDLCYQQNEADVDSSGDIVRAAQRCVETDRNDQSLMLESA